MERLKRGDFNGRWLRREGLWAVCFGADWCPYCQAFRKLYEPLDGTADFHVGWGDVTDEESPLWESFGLEIIPTLVAFRDGQMIWRKDGVAGKGLDASAISALVNTLG